MRADFGRTRLYRITGIWLLAGIGQACAAATSRTSGPELLREIRVGEIVTDTLSDSGPRLSDRGPFRAYRLVARPGEAYDISLRSTDFDAYLSVVTYLGGVPDILRDDDGGGGSNSLLRFKPREAGTYLVIAQALDRKTGTFTISINAPPDDERAAADSVAQPDEASDTAAGSIASPHPLAIGIPIEGVLRGRSALYTFQGTTTDTYLVELSSDAFDSFLEVGTIAADSFRLARSDDDGGAGVDSRLIFTPAAAGPYAIRVSAVGAARGRYTVKVGRAAHAVVGSVRLGTVVRGEITSTDSPVGEANRPTEEWLFAAVAGSRYAATMSAMSEGAKLDTYLSVGRVVNGRFSQVGANDDSPGLPNRTDSRVVFTATESGEYVIRAMPYDADSTGTYELRVDELPRLRAAPERRRIAFGQELEGTLDNSDFELPDGSYVDEWVISATPADTLVASLSSSDFDAFLTVGAMVLGQFVDYSSNDDAAAGSNNARVVMVPPSAGEYVIRANSIMPAALGRYTVKVERKRAQ
ncbi:MAG: hypothetical protein ACR2L6_09625 [Gemmatimonadaceae bacterium]